MNPNPPKPICPCCKERMKADNCGYCNICNRAKVAERYRKSREGKAKGEGWRGNRFGWTVRQ